MNPSDWAAALQQAGLPASTVPSATNARQPIPSRCGAVRTVLAGGDLMKLVNHPSITTLERVWRRNAVDGVFTASPAAPFQFELGAISVPQQMVLVVLDYRFEIYIPSGVIAGDTQPLPPRRLSTSVGYDVKFSDRRLDNVNYELTPSNPNVAAQETYAPYQNGGIIPGGQIAGASAAEFQRLRGDNQRVATASGLSTLPQRERRDAQLAMPFTYVVNSNQRVNLNVVVFNAIPYPIAFFEGELSGLMLPAHSFSAFIKEMNPCVD